MNTDDPKFPKWIYDQIKQMNLEKRQDAAEIFFRQTIEDNAMVITLKAHLHFEKEIDEFPNSARYCLHCLLCIFVFPAA